MGAEADEIAERVLGAGTFSVDKFVETFPMLVEAAGGGAALRSIVLQFALSGRLGTSSPSDERAERLLEAIRKHRRALTSSGLIKKIPEIEPLQEDEHPIPDGWVRVPLGAIVVVIRGASPRPKGDPRYFSATRTPYHWVKISDLRKHSKGTVLCDTDEFLTAEGTRHSVAVEAGTTILTNSATIGVAATMGVDGYIHDGFLAFPHFPDVAIDRSFFLYQLQALSSHLQSAARGLAQLNLNSEIVRNAPVPLPPLAEQKRIVARVDQLMALIDQLEAKQNRKRDLGARFTKASLEALTTAESPQALTTAWTRIHQTWPTLLDHHDKVGDVRRAILKMGIQGRLVAQSAADEPAAALLARIGVQAAGPDSDSVGGELPEGWARVQIGELAVVKSGTTLAPELECASGDWPYLKIADMNLPGNEKEAVLSSRYVRKSDDLRRYLIDPGSIIFPKRGGAIATNKKRMVRRPILVDLNTMAITCPPMMCFEYVYLWFLTIDLAELDNGTSVPQINHKDISPLLLLVPPLPEQKRIVAKVEHLMKLCDALEAALRRREDRAARLAEAVVQEMVG